MSSRWTIEELTEYGHSMPIYTKRGERILSRPEWERLSRWRRLRDVLLGWDPPKGFRDPRRGF